MIIDSKDPLIPEEEAATILGISKWSLMRLRKEKKIAFIRLLRKIFYRRTDLERFIERRRFVPRDWNER